MFDIGISEIMVIAVVALVVIGPERLPRVARTIGTLLGRAQRYVNDVKAEVNREMELEELRKLQSQVQSAAQEIQQSVSSAGAEVQTAVQDVEKSLNETIAPVTDAASAAASSISELPPLIEPPASVAVEAPPASVEPAMAGPAGDGAAASALPPPAPPEPTPELPGIPAPDPGPVQTSLFPEQTLR